MKPLNIKTDFNPHIEKAALTIAPLFELFRWTWAGVESPDGIPTYYEILAKITELVDEVVSGKCKSTGTGRIMVRREHDGLVDFVDISLNLTNLYEAHIQ